MITSSKVGAKFEWVKAEWVKCGFDLVTDLLGDAAKAAQVL